MTDKQTGLIAFTIEGTTNNKQYDMTVEIPEGKTLILKQAVFEITYTGASNYPRVVNVALGNTASADYVIDNDAGYNYFKVALDYNPFTVSGTTLINSMTYPDVGYKVSGRIDKNFTVKLFDTNHNLLPNLVYYFLQFVVI